MFTLTTNIFNNQREKKYLPADEQVNTMAAGITCLMFLFMCLCVRKASADTEHDLHRKLFRDYNTNILPMNGSEPVVVNVALYPTFLQNIDTRSQTISMLTTMMLTWSDVDLTWEPHLYSNVTLTSVKIKDVWVPDLTLVQSYQKPSDMMAKDDTIIIRSNGTIEAWPYGLNQVPCKLTIWKFPFDKQTCNFSFASWTNSKARLRLVPVSLNLMAFYSENGEWSLQTIIVSSDMIWGGDYDQVTFQFIFVRKWLFTLMNIVLPVMLVSWLNLFCFLLPHSSGERVTLSVTVFLTLAVYMTVVTGFLPQTSDEMSVFGLCTGLQLVVSCLTVIIVVISHRVNVTPRYKRSVYLRALMTLSRTRVTASTMYHGKYSMEGEKTTIDKDGSPYEYIGSDVARAMDHICFVCSAAWILTLTSVFLVTVLV